MANFRFAADTGVPLRWAMPKAGRSDQNRSLRGRSGAKPRAVVVRASADPSKENCEAESLAAKELQQPDRARKTYAAPTGSVRDQSLELTVWPTLGGLDEPEWATLSMALIVATDAGRSARSSQASKRIAFAQHVLASASVSATADVTLVFPIEAQHLAT